MTVSPCIHRVAHRRPRFHLQPPSHWMIHLSIYPGCHWCSGSNRCNTCFLGEGAILPPSLCSQLTRILWKTHMLRQYNVGIGVGMCKSLHLVDTASVYTPAKPEGWAGFNDGAIGLRLASSDGAHIPIF